MVLESFHQVPVQAFIYYLPVQAFIYYFKIPSAYINTEDFVLSVSSAIFSDRLPLNKL